MDGVTVVLGAVGLAGVALFAGLIFWLVRQGSAKAVAVDREKALKKAEEAQARGRKIMEEPVADERAWLARARVRAHRRRTDPVQVPASDE